MNLLEAHLMIKEKSFYLQQRSATVKYEVDMSSTYFYYIKTNQLDSKVTWTNPTIIMQNCFVKKKFPLFHQLYL